MVTVIMVNDDHNELMGRPTGNPAVLRANHRGFEGRFSPEKNRFPEVRTLENSGKTHRCNQSLTTILCLHAMYMSTRG